MNQQTGNSDKPLQVIYVAGSGRSGTTVLDRVLGTLDQVTSFNEIYCLMTDGMRENDRCACGTEFNDCDFWKQVTARIFKGPDHVERIQYLYDKFDHMTQFLRIYSGLYGGQYKRDLEEYKAWLADLYFTLAELCGNRIIVDSSKVPTRALLLGQIPGIEVHLVHMVRDVRAVVYAWQREKFNPAYERKLPTYASLRSVRFWYARNLLTELLRTRMPYQRVVYEDVVSNPHEVLPALVNALEPLRDKALTFEDDGSIILDSLHTIGGNPDRFRTGPTHLRLDAKWVANLPDKSRRLVTLVAYPLLAHYGYTSRFTPEKLAERSA